MAHPTHVPGPAVRYESPAWRPDSRSFYLRTDQGREAMTLAAFDVPSRRLTFVEETSWDVEELALSEDGRTLATVVNADGYGELRVRDLQTERPIDVPGLPRGVVSELAFSRDGRRLAFDLSGARLPEDVWVCEIPSGKLVQVTRSWTAGIPPPSFADSELVHVTTFDGRSLSGFLYRPAGSAGQKVPVVINVHGGPESQSRPSFSPLTQYFIHRGFAVFYPNVRGSTGYGKSFSHLDDVDRRLDAVRDLAECAKWLVASGIAREGKVAVMGGSYGGYMTLAALAFGISNFRSFLASTGAWRRNLRAAEYGDPETDGESLRPGLPDPLGGPHSRAPHGRPGGQRPPRSAQRGGADGRGDSPARGSGRVPPLP